jgi:hypothetical protein
MKHSMAGVRTVPAAPSSATNGEHTCHLPYVHVCRRKGSWDIVCTSHVMVKTVHTKQRAGGCGSGGRCIHAAAPVACSS